MMRLRLQMLAPVSVRCSCEIGERPRQPVDLIDNDNLNLAGLDVLQKPLESRPFHRPAGQASVIVHVRKRDPSGVPLAHDVGLARLPLGVERIELLLEALVGRFSGVDRAADGESGEHRLLHAARCRLPDHKARTEKIAPHAQRPHGCLTATPSDAIWPRRVL
jgi:hypothetical protein